MSEKSKPDSKSGGKGTKTPCLTALLMGSAGNSKSSLPASVTPVLREVGKLAAGVASVSTSNGKNLSSGSATGNPRNKVALQPGHSLMDWIRLGTSGRDLAGFGSRAGSLSITNQELSKHNKRNDAWLAIRGKVYNVTEYFPFHPGGVKELMRGAGIDATTLFNEVHPWVNYEQILHKCLIGKLVAIDPSIDAEALFFGEKQSPSGESNRLDVSSAKSAVLPPPPPQLQLNPPDQTTPPPRFDWIQKLNCITVIFYTKPFSNPLIEVSQTTDEQNVTVTLSYAGRTFKNELAFDDKVGWPCDMHLAVETGKVELVFRKYSSGIWKNYGVLKQNNSHISNNQGKCEYVLTRKMEVNYNTWLLKFERLDGRKIVVPIGKHVRVFGSVDGEDISKSYTPVPESLFDNFSPHSALRDGVTLMVKRYPDGRMSRFITDKEIQESIEFSKPLGNFDLNVVEKRDIFLLLSGGTGITPMLGLVVFLLERRIKKCQFLRLLFFNRTERDILFRSQLEDLQKSDKSFRIDNILSEPAASWDGYKGHITEKLIDNSIQEQIKDTGYTIKDVFCFVCGPPKFNEVAISELNKIHIDRDQSHVFEG